MRLAEQHPATGIRQAAGRSAVRRLIPLTLFLFDAALMYAAFAVAYWVRYSLEVGPHIKSVVSFAEYQPLAFMVAAIMLIVLTVKGAYRDTTGTDGVDQVGAIISAATLTVGAVVVITTMINQDQYSRGVIIYLWVLLILFVGGGRLFYRAVQGAAHRRGWGARRVLVVGASDAGKMAMQGMMARPDLGYHLAGFVYGRNSSGIQDFGRFRALGTVSDLPDLIDRHAIDEVVIALPASEHEEVWPILRLCTQRGVALKLIPDLFEVGLSRVRVDDIAGIPLLDVRDRAFAGTSRAMKRLLDVVLAGILGLLSLPLLAVLIPLIRMESPGTAVLRQERVGMGGRRFTCYKLRTMRHDADELRPALLPRNEMDGPMFKMRDDPRRTRVGAWMRTWSLDEIPQLYNVIRGEMSMVGPRPPLPLEVAQYSEEHARRLEVKPGMTGIWQVSGRSDLSFDEMVLMDVYYVENWTLALDIRIMLRTVAAVILRQGAY